MIRTDVGHWYAEPNVPLDELARAARSAADRRQAPETMHVDHRHDEPCGPGCISHLPARYTHPRP